MKPKNSGIRILISFCLMALVFSCTKRQVISDYTKKEKPQQKLGVMVSEFGTPDYLIMYNKGVQRISQKATDRGLASAIMFFEKAIKNKKDFWPAHYNLAYIFFNQKEYKKAQTHIKKASYYHRNREIDLLEATISLKMGKENLAFEQYRMIYKKFNSDPFALAQMGAILMASSYCNEAISYFEKIGPIKKETYKVFVNKGTCFMKLKKFESALIAFEAVYNLNIKDEYLLGQYAYTLMKTNNIRKAEKVYIEIIDKYPDNVSSYKNIGILYELYMQEPFKAALFYEEYVNRTGKNNNGVENWNRIALEKAEKARK